jgi:hypothetical protein
MAAALAATACGSGPGDEANPAQAADGADPTTVACGLFANGGDNSLVNRIPPAITGISEDLTPAQLAEIIDVNQSLTAIINQAPPDLAAILAPINSPLQQFVDSGGTVTLDSDYEVRVLRNILDGMKWCADAGFVFE